MKAPVLTLRTEIMVLVASTLFLALLVTGLLVSWRVEARTRAILAEKATTVSRLSAQDAEVVEALTGRRPLAAVQAFADRVRGLTGVDYIVVLDLAGTRLSHPNPGRIGERFQGGDEAAVFRGQTYASVAKGSLGPALRVFSPVRDGQGRQVGAVVVGVLLTGIDQHLLGVRRMVLLGLGFGFATGLLGALLVSRRIKRILMGMEPAEIASMLLQRTATLHTVREETLAEQLAGVRLYADALRAQTHEFMNKLHVILGLLRLEEYARLTTYLRDISEQFQGEVGNVVRAIKDPILAGFLLARFSAAREQDIRMTLSEDSRTPLLSTPALSHNAITILGNFLQNAVEAIGTGGNRSVVVRLCADQGWLTIQVRDSGPGLDPAWAQHLFSKGFTTKGAGHGYGLQHSLRCAAAAGGRLSAVNDARGGALFTALLPIPEEEDQP